MLSEALCLVALLIMYFIKIQSITFGERSHKQAPSPNLNKKFRIYCTFGKTPAPKIFILCRFLFPHHGLRTWVGIAAKWFYRCI